MMHMTTTVAAMARFHSLMTTLPLTLAPDSSLAMSLNAQNRYVAPSSDSSQISSASADIAMAMKASRQLTPSPDGTCPRWPST